MKDVDINLVIHPIRLKIIKILEERQMTPSELQKQLYNVPQATLYRNINLLEEKGIIQIEKETQKRGTVERTYSLISDTFIISPEQISKLSREELFKYFSVFTAILLGDFQNYISSNYSFKEDGAGIHHIDLYLNDKERKNLNSEVEEVIQKYKTLDKSNDRDAMNLTIIKIPKGKKEFL